MATTAKWETPDNISTALSTELNSLQSGSGDGDDDTALSSAINNLTGLYLYVDLELYLATVDLSSQTKLAVYIWFVTSVDESNYEDGSAGTPGTKPARQPDVIIPLRAVNGTQRIIMVNIPIAPYSFKILLENKAGAAFASSGNTLKYRRHNTQGV